MCVAPRSRCAFVKAGARCTRTAASVAVADELVDGPGSESLDGLARHARPIEVERGRDRQTPVVQPPGGEKNDVERGDHRDEVSRERHDGLATR